MKGRPVRLGLVGLGTVGGGVVEMLQKNKALIEEKSGVPVELAMVCDKKGISLAEVRKMGLESIFTRDAEKVILNSEIDIFIELIGGYEPARTFVLKGAACRQACGDGQQGASREILGRCVRGSRAFIGGSFILRRRWAAAFPSFNP